MPANNTSHEPLHGLTDEEVRASRIRHGRNVLYLRPKRQLWHILKEVVQEPFFLLLLLACSLYFAIGDNTEAWLMVAALCFVTAIEIIQEYRSEKTLLALRNLTQPKVTVRRNGVDLTIDAADVVINDLILFSEGERLPADARLVQQYDLSIDESLLTGESLPVNKTLEENENRLFQGTTATSGMGIGQVEAIGGKTALSKLGKTIELIDSTHTPLQLQIDRFVRQMILMGLFAFLLVFGVNMYYLGAIIPALLFSLALALALVPAEIPVAFTSFMALGAYRMSRKKILVKQSKTVESLGSATVICLDKTGTITENRMQVAEVLDWSVSKNCLEYAMWSSEPQPFDPMEKAIHTAFAAAKKPDRRSDFQMVHEYPLDGTPPMMTHVYENKQGERIIAAKGAVERVLEACSLLDSGTQTKALQKTKKLASRGYRVLGVARAEWAEDRFPKEQNAFPWQFEGLIALYDPPKKNIKAVLEQFYQAGIQVKMITGDYPETAQNIARQSGLQHEDNILTGKAILGLNDEALRAKVDTTNVFARMFPDTKLRVVEMLKSRGEVVAMTGDGVNDGPALKAAQIGVAMGKRGTEVAKAAASMVLLDDDLSRMVTAIHLGRNIYNNLRKAIRYVISIHIPIILVVMLPLVFGWTYLHILGPIHVILMELIMDPTCAIAFENEPAEPGLMKKEPRALNTPLFTGRELGFSVFQGLVITAGVLGTYQYALSQGASEEKTRAFVFTTLILSNIFLTIVNRSFKHTALKTIANSNRMIPVILGITTLILAAILFIPWATELFRLEPLSWQEIGICLGAALLSVAWFEVWKAVKASFSNKKTAL